MRKALLLAGAAMFAFVSAADAQTYYRGQRQNQYPQYNARTYSYGPTPQYYVPQPYGQQQQTYGIRPYIGLDYVYSMSDIDIKINGIDVSPYLEDDLSAFAVSFGLKFNQHFGLEMFYQQSIDGEKDLSPLEKTETKYKAYGFDLVGYLPVAPQLDLLGSVGVGYYDAEASYEQLGIEVLSLSDDGFGWRIGAGGQFNITNNWGIRVMVRYVDPDVEGLNNMVDISAGIRYTF